MNQKDIARKGYDRVSRAYRGDAIDLEDPIDWTGGEDDRLGVKGARMLWSHGDAATYAKWLEGSGFSIVRERFVP